MAHLLIVEDDPLIQRSLIRALKTHACVGASNGLEALRCLDAGAPFDLVISDVDMPVMNGIEFFRCVARLFPELKILFRTGSNTSGLWTLGAPIISKARPLEELVAQVEFHLGVITEDASHQIQGQALSQVGGR